MVTGWNGTMNPCDLVEAVPIPLVYIAPDARIGAMNKGAEALFGAQALGRHYITALRQPEILDRVEAARTDNQVRKGRYLTSDAGRDLVFSVTVSPVQGQGGQIVAFEDVTPLQDVRQMRSDFVANVSHELRTPLTALLGFIETLRGPARDDAAARDRFLDIMGAEAERMNRLVQDLLSLSRVEDVARQRPTQNIDICGVIASAADSVRATGQMGAANIEIKGCVGDVLAPGDADQLRQVFINLIENALKYGAPDAPVTVTVSQHEHLVALRMPGLRIDVEDQGPGIAQSHLARLTERFYRVDSHRSRELGGTGLGLAIVKHIVNRHRGRLQITSTLGQGSCFSVLLPNK